MRNAKNAVSDCACGLRVPVPRVRFGRASYRGGMASGTTVEPVLDMETAVSHPPAPELAHGYPPPVRPAGSAVVAYCGAPMIVRGESTFTPPPDSCPACVEIWERRRQQARGSPVRAGST